MSKADIISPKKRVELALQRKFADKVPFTVYESLIPRSNTERLLRNKGMCIVSFGNLSFSALNLAGDYLGHKTYLPKDRWKENYITIMKAIDEKFSVN